MSTCTCEWCSEDYPGCSYCEDLATYDPCPNLGYGCGTGATSTTARCDCCTLAQWTAASD